MRELKFRAWDKDMQEMVGVNMIQFMEHAPYKTPVILDSINDFHDVSDIILMQYTGIKDKNGKEIYEGDILRCGEYWNGDTVEKESVVLIKWNDEEAFYENLPLVGYQNEPEWCEVIGNIYENPELLEEEE